MSTDLTTLALGTGGLASYNDLGTGSYFGSATVSNASNGQYVLFNLNAAGVAAFESARNGQGLIGVGARLRTTNVVPEPSTYALMAAGLAGLALARRRRAV